METSNLTGLTIPKLKAILTANGQPVGGNKQELISKIIDGRTNGRIPKCPRCYGGRPKYDSDTNTYRCPGYKDDDEMRFCNMKFFGNELPREKWIE